jgi:hypothetical protein
MKRSKIFLSVTTIILAIAAVAATKAKKATIVTGYYSIGSGCTVGVSLACTTGTAKNCTFVTSGQTHVALFTHRAGACVNQLEKK